MIPIRCRWCNRLVAILEEGHAKVWFVCTRRRRTPGCPSPHVQVQQVGREAST